MRDKKTIETEFKKAVEEHQSALKIHSIVYANENIKSAQDVYFNLVTPRKEKIIELQKELDEHKQNEMYKYLVLYFFEPNNKINICSFKLDYNNNFISEFDKICYDEMLKDYYIFKELETDYNRLIEIKNKLMESEN